MKKASSEISPVETAKMAKTMSSASGSSKMTEEKLIDQFISDVYQITADPKAAN